MGSTGATNDKVNFMSILFDLLRVVAETLIEQRGCYLSGWENDNDILQSFKDILNLADEFYRILSNFIEFYIILY